MHVHVSVCLSVRRRMATPYSTDPNVTWGNGRGCPLVVHYWADLQSVLGFRCHDNIARTRNVSECLYSLYAWLMRRFTCSWETEQHGEHSAGGDVVALVLPVLHCRR